MAPDSLGDGRPAPAIDVHRPSRPRLLFLGFGLLVLMAAYIAAIAIFELTAVPWYLDAGYKLLAGAAGAAIGLGIKSYAMRRVLTYDPQTRSVEARERLWGQWEDYPREGFERLEYESESGRLYEVGADGRRRRVPVDRREAIGAEWRAFVEQFERDHASGEAGAS